MSKQKRGAAVRVNLTKRSVEALEFASPHSTTFYDEQVRGLGVVVLKCSNL